MPRKFLIVMLSSNGDCVMVTTLARQLKHNDSDCHITWAISYKCRQAIDNNPHVDRIWEIQYSTNEDVWEKVKKEAEEKKLNGEFDEILYCPIFPDHRERFDGTTRSSTFRVYSQPITIPVSPVIRLYESEIENVKEFSKKYQLTEYKHVVLCECAPSSIQTFLNPALMLNIANKIIEYRDDVLFIISTHLELGIKNKRIIDASELSYRENAELSKYCTLLVGCSSGITWLLTSDWAKQIPTIQFLNKSEERPLNFASVKYDFKYYGLTTDHIIESSENNLSKMVEIINASLDDFGKSKKSYDEDLKPSIKMFRLYLTDIFRFRKIGKSFRNSFIFLKNFGKRNNKGIGFYLLFPFFLLESIIKRFQYEFLVFFAKKKSLQ